MSGERVLIVSPVRNEAEHIETAIRGVLAQTRPPDAWIVVDDGSTDRTPEILRSWEPHVSFMQVRSTPAHYTSDRGDRHAVAAAPRAFNWGLRAVDLDEFSHIGKLDGDIELPPEYFELVLGEFERDPALGMGGGTVVELSGSEWLPVRLTEQHVRGALKLYTRDCFEAIGGIEERLGWDGIDETYARMKGFSTRSFAHITARHHRPLGAADGQLRGRVRLGESHYVLRYNLLWVLLKSLKLSGQRPIGISGAAFLHGYLRAAARSAPRVEDADYRRFMRRDLRRRLLRPFSVG